MSINLPSKIIGIGWNYANHIKELSHLTPFKPPTKPLFFLKPPSSITTKRIELPKGVQVHYEVELGVYIGKRAKNIEERNALDYVKGYCLALDMTARNLQADAKQNGQPWSQSKGYDTFCPISSYIRKSEIDDPQSLRLELALVDGLKSDTSTAGIKLPGKSRIVQNGLTKNMIFSVSQLISYLSKTMTLEEGDLILTGTPEGVGMVKNGQLLVGKLFKDTSNSRVITEMAIPAIDRGY